MAAVRRWWQPVLEALVQLMTAHAEDETPKKIGKIKTAQAFGKPGQLLSFEQRKLTEQGQWYETRIRTFVVFHEDAAVVLWAEGPPDGVKKRDDVLLRIFSTFSGHRPAIANHPTRGNNPSPMREATAASREKIIEAVANYVSASATTWRDLFLHIGDHPELLTDEAIEIFETLVRQAKLECAANDPRLKQLINHRDILLKAHQAMSGGYLGDSSRGGEERRQVSVPQTEQGVRRGRTRYTCASARIRSVKVPLTRDFHAIWAW